jgi:hypothetical protein
VKREEIEQMSSGPTRASSILHCTQCGSPAEPDTRFCEDCGTAISAPVPRPPSPPKPHAGFRGKPASDETAELEALVALHPDDETYQKLLAVQLHDHALKDWWKDPKTGNLLCTTVEQIQHARKQLDRAAALRFNDPALRAGLEKLRRTVESQEARKYTGNWFQIVLLGIFYIFPGWIWWYVNRRPEFMLNRDYMKYVKTGKEPGALAKMGGSAEKVSNFFDSATGGWGFVFAFIFMFICSPIMMLLAYKENYIDVKKEYESS